MASSLYTQFATNVKAETEGVWVEIPLIEGEPMKFKLGAMARTNPRYKASFEKHSRSFKKRNKVGLNQIEQVEKAVFIEVILKDWQNVPNEDDGEFLSFSKENATKLLELLPKLYYLLLEEATEESLFEVKSLAKSSKN